MSASLYVKKLIVNNVNSFVVSLAGSYALSLRVLHFGTKCCILAPSAAFWHQVLHFGTNSAAFWHQVLHFGTNSAAFWHQ
jgi:hypothetical protein